MAAESSKRQRTNGETNAALQLGVISGKEDTVLSTDMGHVTAKPQDIDLVIFHGRCPDGFTGAYAAWLALGDRATYIGIGHGAREEKSRMCGDVTGKHVAVVDFSFDAPTTMEHLQVAASLVVLDHHASAESCLVDLPAANKVFEMRQSGATLAWNFWHPGKECPQLLRYIEDKDIWRWAMHNSKEFSAIFELEMQIPESGAVTSDDFLELDRLVQGGDVALLELVQRGRTMLQYQNNLVQRHKKRAVLRRLKAFPSLTAAVVNGTVLPSEIGNAATQIDGANFALVWNAQADGSGFSISARSCFPAEGQADVSLIAKHFGGGGHRAASGFRVPGSTIEDIFTAYDPLDAPEAKACVDRLVLFAEAASEDAAKELDFPATTSPAVRRMLHEAAEQRGLTHESVGSGDERFLRITKGSPEARACFTQLELFAADAAQKVLDFPKGTSPAIRKMLHGAAEKRGLEHESVGSGDERFLHVTKKAE